MSAIRSHLLGFGRGDLILVYRLTEIPIIKEEGTTVTAPRPTPIHHPELKIDFRILPRKNPFRRCQNAAIPVDTIVSRPACSDLIFGGSPKLCMQLFCSRRSWPPLVGITCLLMQELSCICFSRRRSTAAEDSSFVATDDNCSAAAEAMCCVTREDLLLQHNTWLLLQQNSCHLLQQR